MTLSVEVVEAATPAQFQAARALIVEYAAHIGNLMGVDLCFQNFSAELERLPEMYGPPSGSLLLALRGGEPVGCCALRHFDDGVCEMKRLYVSGVARGTKLGHVLAQGIIDRARALGYRRMVLDTLQAMTAAQTLYRSLGFRETQPYYFNPLAGVAYMELSLEPAATGDAV